MICVCNEWSAIMRNSAIECESFYNKSDHDQYWYQLNAHLRVEEEELREGNQIGAFICQHHPRNKNNNANTYWQNNKSHPVGHHNVRTMISFRIPIDSAAQICGMNCWCCQKGPQTIITRNSPPNKLWWGSLASGDLICEIFPWQWVWEMEWHSRVGSPQMLKRVYKFQHDRWAIPTRATENGKETHSFELWDRINHWPPK